MGSDSPKVRPADETEVDKGKGIIAETKPVPVLKLVAGRENANSAGLNGLTSS